MSLLPDSLNYDLNLQLQALQSRSRRNGKVARLPAALRDQINRQIDDGVPYKTIIASLGPPGQHLTEDNLSNWRLGGYQDYLKAQALNERAGVQMETAADLVRENPDLDPAQLRRTCTQMGLLNYLNTFMEHGKELLDQCLSRNPAKIITLMNSCANASNAELQMEKHRSPDSAHPGSTPHPSSP